MTYVYQAELFTRRIMKCCNAYRHTHKKISWESADRTTLSGIALHCSMHDDGYSRRINFGGSIIQMAQTSVVQEVRSLRGMDRSVYRVESCKIEFTGDLFRHFCSRMYHLYYSHNAQWETDRRRDMML